jgi:hypothetical protein
MLNAGSVLGPFWSVLRKKGRKDRSTGATMLSKPGQIEVIRHSDGMHSVFERTPVDPVKRNQMGGIGRRSDPPKQGDDKSKKPPPPPVDDDEFEDGDIATPKRDRHGNDDEPL